MVREVGSPINTEIENEMAILKNLLKSKSQELKKAEDESLKFAKKNFREFEKLFENRTADLKEEARGLRKLVYSGDSKVRELTERIKSMEKEIVRLSGSDQVINALKKQILGCDKLNLALKKRIDELSAENEELGAKHFSAIMMKR